MFPAKRLAEDVSGEAPETAREARALPKKILRRHHLKEDTIQRAVKLAAIGVRSPLDN